jgi:hypothetical protein
MDLCIRTGLEVLDHMMEEDRIALCGPAGRHDPDRTAYRGGSAPGEITLAGRRVALRRPRVRTVEQSELAVPAYRWAADRDPLEEATWKAMVHGVATRRYEPVQPALPAPIEGRAASKSLRRPGGTRDARNRRRRHQIRPGRPGGHDRERDGRARASERPGDARAARRPPAAVRDRRSRGASQSDPRDVRHARGGASLPTPQDPKRARPSPEVLAQPDREGDGAGLQAVEAQARCSTVRAARPFARDGAPECRGVAAP